VDIGGHWGVGGDTAGPKGRPEGGRFLGTLRRRLIFNRSVGSLYICAGAALAGSDTQAISGNR